MTDWNGNGHTDLTDSVIDFMIFNETMNNGNKATRRTQTKTKTTAGTIIAVITVIIALVLTLR